MILLFSGPLSFLDPRTDQVKVVGLTSHGERPCIKPGYPTVYSDIAKQLAWVEGIIGDCNKESVPVGGAQPNTMWTHGQLSSSPELHPTTVLGEIRF